MAYPHHPRFRSDLRFDWFTSDPHFLHKNIITFANRPFGTVEQMDAAMINAWNDCVQPGQNILCLGDFSLSKDQTALDRIMSRLQGNKFIIPGNHEAWLKHQQLHHYWTILNDVERFVLIDERTQDKHNCIASHFPFYTWEGAHKGNFMLHGHCHSNIDAANANTTRIDLGVDSTAKWTGSYRPVSAREVLTKLKTKVYTPVDHHGFKNED